MKTQAQQKTSLDELPYLLHHLSFLLDKEVDVALTEELGTSLVQLKVLYVLERWPYSQQRSIARILGQNESGISRRLQQLRDAGYVTTKQNPKDRRQQIVVMTSNGKDLLGKARAITKRCHNTALTALNTTQREQLRDVLELLHRRSCTPEAGCERYIR